jgi:hypothetical protein
MAAYDKAFYLYEWTDANDDAAPDAADTFALIASAP